MSEGEMARVRSAGFMAGYRLVVMGWVVRIARALLQSASEACVVPEKLYGCAATPQECLVKQQEVLMNCYYALQAGAFTDCEVHSEVRRARGVAAGRSVRGSAPSRRSLPRPQSRTS